MPNGWTRLPSAQRLLPGLYDPTGLTFEQPGGTFSSELNSIVGGGGEPYRMIPTLVPGQVGIESILAGKPLSREQEAIRQRYAQSRADEVPSFAKLADALAYEKRRHQQLEQNAVPVNPQDVISSLYSLLGAFSR